MIGAEDLCVDTRELLRATLPGNVTAINLGREQAFAADCPADQSYYIGPWSRFQTYRMPSLFVMLAQSTPQLPAAPVDQWWHSLDIAGLVEADGIERCQRKCFRLAEAIYAALRNADPHVVPWKSGTLICVGAQWGTMIAPRDRSSTFRSDFMLRFRADFYISPTIITPS